MTLFVFLIMVTRVGVYASVSNCHQGACETDDLAVGCETFVRVGSRGLSGGNFFDVTVEVVKRCRLSLNQVRSAGQHSMSVAVWLSGTLICLPALYTLLSVGTSWSEVGDVVLGN